MTTHNNTVENLDELRKRAIEKLFEEAEYKPARIYSLAERLADYATLNARGDVFIKRKIANLPDKYKVGLVVAARFIGHVLRDEIEEIISVDEDNNPKDQKFIKMIAEKNKQFGFINIYCGKTSTLSSCCRLRSDADNEYFNAFGSGSVKIGSLGVVTTNLPRLAIKSKTKEKFLENLRELVIDVARINNAKRHIIKKRIEVGVSPLYSLGFMSIDKQYSTFGITGLNEAIELLGYDILEQDGQQLVLDMLEIINKTNDKLQKQYNAPHNCEQVPAENSGIKLSKKDKLLKYTEDSLFYSNQFIPLIKNADMLDRIKLQGMFDSKFSGGAILHLNIEEQIVDTQKIIDLINICAKMGVVYWAVNYNLQMCEANHMSVGANGKCPVCGKPIKENFTRVVGFLTNIKNWNSVRRNVDYPNRQFYKNI